MKYPYLTRTPAVRATLVNARTSVEPAARVAILAMQQSRVFGFEPGCPSYFLLEKDLLEVELPADSRVEWRPARANPRLKPRKSSPSPEAESSCPVSGSLSRLWVWESLTPIPGTRPSRGYVTFGRGCEDDSGTPREGQEGSGPSPHCLNRGAAIPTRTIPAARQAFPGAPPDRGLSARGSLPVAAPSLVGPGLSTQSTLHEGSDTVFERRRIPPSAEQIRGSA